MNEAQIRKLVIDAANLASTTEIAYDNKDFDALIRDALAVESGGAKPMTWLTLQEKLGVPPEHFQVFCCEAVAWMCADQPDNDSMILQVRDGKVAIGSVKGFANFWLPRHLKRVEKGREMVKEAVEATGSKLVGLDGKPVAQ